MDTQQMNSQQQQLMATPRLKTDQRQTLGLVQTPQTQNAAMGERNERVQQIENPLFAKDDQEPIDSVTLNIKEENFQLEQNERFAAVFHEELASKKMMPFKWLGATTKIAPKLIEKPVYQTMSPKYEPSYEPLNFDWDY